jgi:hypothetical protein
VSIYSWLPFCTPFAPDPRLPRITAVIITIGWPSMPMCRTMDRGTKIFILSLLSSIMTTPAGMPSQCGTSNLLPCQSTFVARAWINKKCYPSATCVKPHAVSMCNDILLSVILLFHNFPQAGPATLIPARGVVVRCKSRNYAQWSNAMMLQDDRCTDASKPLRRRRRPSTVLFCTM